MSEADNVVDLPPLVRHDRPLPALVWDRREQWPGRVLMACGDRVFAAWNRGPGPERAGSVPAGHVVPITSFVQET